MNISSHVRRDLQVTQADNEDRYSSALVPVTVQAVNIHAPQFANSRQVVNVMENSPVGASVVTVIATDPDQVRNFGGGNGTGLQFLSVFNISCRKNYGIVNSLCLGGQVYYL